MNHYQTTTEPVQVEPLSDHDGARTGEPLSDHDGARTGEPLSPISDRSASPEQIHTGSITSLSSSKVQLLDSREV